MATRSSALFPSNSTTALFDAWVNEIDGSLIAYGWTRSGDSGEAAMPTSSGRPTAVATYPIWVVYKMGDTLQSSCAVFMRIDYGTGAGTDVPSIKMTIGIGGTNGSGTLTGNVAAQFTLQGDVSNTTFNSTQRTAGNSSSFRMSFWQHQDGGMRGWTFAIERDLDTSGANTANGICYAAMQVAGGNTKTQYLQYLDVSGTFGPVDTTWYAMVSQQTSQASAGTVGVGPVRPSYGPLRNPMKGLLVTARTDFLPNATNPIIIYGASHTYLMLRNASVAHSLNTWNSDCGYALLWE